MTAPFGNVAYTFNRPNGKPVYVPTPAGRLIASQLLKKVKARFEPDPFYYHLRDGGHVAALHVHRRQKYFARMDLENFFYSIPRNRIARALHDMGVPRGEFYAKWSTVKSPFAGPRYVLPYGFAQSPMLASLVLYRSPLGKFLRELPSKVVVSVYVDDIAISSNNKRFLKRSYRKLRQKAIQSSFSINEQKTSGPGSAIELFNCYLAQLQTEVTDDRRAKFYEVVHSPRSEDSFERYCETVELGNGRP